MIKSNIIRQFPDHLKQSGKSFDTLYLADYTHQTNSERAVEVLDYQPDDIEVFTTTNDVKLPLRWIVFDQDSFRDKDNLILSQCECVLFPEESNEKSWILFVELKYGTSLKKNTRNVRKAVEQLDATRKHYLDKSVFEKTNTCYLIVSLPKQTEPFAQSVLSPVDLLNWKKQHNVILRLQNGIDVKSDKELG